MMIIIINVDALTRLSRNLTAFDNLKKIIINFLNNNKNNWKTKMGKKQLYRYFKLQKTEISHRRT